MSDDRRQDDDSRMAVGVSLNPAEETIVDRAKLLALMAERDRYRDALDDVYAYIEGRGLYAGASAEEWLADHPRPGGEPVNRQSVARPWRLEIKRSYSEWFYDTSYTTAERAARRFRTLDRTTFWGPDVRARAVNRDTGETVTIK